MTRAFKCYKQIKCLKKPAIEARYCSVIGKIEDFPITSIIVHNFTYVKLAREQ